MTRGPEPASDDDNVGHFDIAPAVAAAVAAARRRADSGPSPSPPASAAPAAPAAPAAGAEAEPPVAAPDEFAPPPIGGRGIDRGRYLRLATAAACGVLALALLAQIVHHWRADLVSHGWFAGSLSRLYAALGAPITPNWDVDAYEIRQLGAAAAATPGGALIIRASVKNGAPRAQPVPVIQLTLQDRFGNRLASRALEPQEYLAPGNGRTVLAAGERVDTEIAVADPGQNAVGFEIDTCLHAANGALRCAAERRPP